MILIVVTLAVHEYSETRNSIWSRIKNPETVQILKRFVISQKAQAYAATNSVPPEIQTMFKYAERGNWLALSNSIQKLQERNSYFDSLGYGMRHWHGLRGAVEDFITDAAEKFGSPLPWNYWAPPRLQGTSGETIEEIYGAFEGFETGDEKYSAVYANQIISSIPSGSIYFSGAGPGRFLITAMQKSHVNGDPFFTLDPYALADSTYLEYVRSMYGNKIYIPTAEDSKKCFNDYDAGIQKQMRNHQFKPDGLAVMDISGLLAKDMFDQNTNREFYIQENYPFDWMYLYLEPHGLIFKLNRKSQDKLSDEIIQQDCNYWTNTLSPIIGNWLNGDTSVSNIAAFAEKVFLRHDFNGFNGDTNFVFNAYSQRIFSKARSSIARLYAWRAQHATDSAEKQRMRNEADFAFRQSWALCPGSPEAVFRYVQFLMQTNRVDDALIVARTALAFDPDNSTVSSFIKNLEQYEQTSALLLQSPSQLRSMEDEACTNPADYEKIFSLAVYYLEKQQTNRASELLLETASRPGASIDALHGIARFFAQLNDFSHLQSTLQKITVAQPGAPEPWYDLARVDSALGKDDEAIQCLRIAIDFSDRRRQTNAMSLDIRSAARTAKDFESIWDRPEFQKLVQP